MRNVLLTLIFMMSAGSVHAGEVGTDIVEISPGFGYYQFDGERDLDDSVLSGVGLALYFSRRWAAVAQYRSVGTTSSSGQHTDVRIYHLDVLRFFNSENRLRPYLAAGLGQMDLIVPGSKTNLNMLNGGLGLYFKMTDAWSVRADARGFISTNNDFQDGSLTLTLGYRFGGGERNNK